MSMILTKVSRGGSRFVGRGSQSVVVICHSTYEPGGGGGGICVFLLTQGLVLRVNIGWLLIDTSSDVGLYTCSFTVMFATDTGGLRPPFMA